MDNNVQVVEIESEKFKYINYYAVLAHELDMVIVFGNHITGGEFFIDWSHSHSNWHHGDPVAEAHDFIADFEAGKYGVRKDFDREFAFEALDLLDEDELEEYFGTTDLKKVMAMLQAELDLAGI